MRCGNMFSVSSVCLSVCLSVGLMLQLLKALTSQAYFWYAGTSSEYLGQVCISRSSGQGQGHRSKKWSVYPVLAGSKFRKPGPGSSIFGKKVRIRNVSITFCVSRSLVKVKVKVIAAKKPCLCMILFAGGLPSIKGNLVSN